MTRGTQAGVRVASSFCKSPHPCKPHFHRTLIKLKTGLRPVKQIQTQAQQYYYEVKIVWP